MDGRLTEDKYKGSLERCGKIVARWSDKAVQAATILAPALATCLLADATRQRLAELIAVRETAWPGRGKTAGRGYVRESMDSWNKSMD